MRIRLLCVGKPRDADLIRRHDDYAARIRRFGVRYDADHVRETSDSRYSDQEVRRRESRALTDRIDSGSTVVVLDPRGEQGDSPTFAARLERWIERPCSLVIGGPLGLDEEFRRSATAVWSLSEQTFPHELVRLLVAEQVYRALTILRGLPYHK